MMTAAKKMAEMSLPALRQSTAPVSTLVDCIKTGLDRNEALLVVVTDDTWEALLMELEQVGILAMELMGRGQLVYIDAEKIAKAVIPKGIPNRLIFNGLVDFAISGLRSKFNGLRCYGELNDVLCARGQGTDAATLQTYWTDYVESRCK
jgi:hypothetical protein